MPAILGMVSKIAGAVLLAVFEMWDPRKTLLTPLLK
jgi:hypothetical protein